MSGERDRIEIYKDKRGKYRWRRMAANGRIVGASSCGYERKKDCEANLMRGQVTSDQWEFFRDRSGAWRWRRMDLHGEVVGAASEGYKARGDAIANAERHGYRG